MLELHASEPQDWILSSSPSATLIRNWLAVLSYQHPNPGAQPIHATARESIDLAGSPSNKARTKPSSFFVGNRSHDCSIQLSGNVYN